jgi:hypothetical protein
MTTHIPSLGCLLTVLTLSCGPLAHEAGIDLCVDDYSEPYVLDAGCVPATAPCGPDGGTLIVTGSPYPTCK